MHQNSFIKLITFVSTFLSYAISAHAQSSPSAQKPLTHHYPFTKVQQDGSVCRSHGESQWTGTVSVSDTRDVFYWFFDSRNDPANDPIILYMAGGPGASAMSNAVNGLGPCTLNSSDDKTPGINPWSWNNNASLLFIDQPAGTGFAKLADDEPVPISEQHTAPDFQQFLKTFFDDVFPDRSHLPLHISSTSYGGHYGPVYVQHIMDSRRKGSDKAFHGNITSLILIDAVVDFTATAVGGYEMLCKESAHAGIINSSACEFMHEHLPEQLRLGQICQDVYHGEECRVAYDYSQKYVHAPMNELVEQHKINLGDIRDGCRPIPDFPYCLPPGYMDVGPFFNQPHVKAAFDVPESFVFRGVNTEMHLAFRTYGSPWNPTIKELTNVLNAFDQESPVADIKVLVINANEDYIVNAAGNAWLYDRLEWAEQAEYAKDKWWPLSKEMGVTGTWKGLSSGRLAFVRVDDCGHFLTSQVQEGTHNIMQKWLAEEWHK